MIKREIGIGVLKKLAIKLMIGSVANQVVAQEERMPCNEVQVNQNAQSAMVIQNNQCVIDSLTREIGALELALGKMIVERERNYEKPRLRTIAKRHILKINTMRKERWMRDARSLARYFNTVKENDVVIAQQLLNEFLPVVSAKVKVEPNFNGTTMGAYEADKLNQYSIGGRNG